MILYDIFTDDLFYYLEIARNIVENSFSSFDGITHTNGYHPLWMVFLVGLGKLIPIGTINFALSLVGLVILINVSGACIFMKLQKTLFPDVQYSLVGIGYFYAGLHLSESGMEVTLIFLFFPLFVLSAIKASERSNDIQFLVLGLTASFLVLSRLDTIILVSIIILAFIYFMFSTKSIHLSTKRLGLFLAGLIPLIAYLTYNLIQFGNIVPISGQAKSLHLDGWGFSKRGLRSMLYTISISKTLIMYLLTIILAIPFMARDFFKEIRAFNYISLSVAIWPIVFYVFYLIRSDWPMGWLWYYYPLGISFTLSLIVLERHAHRLLRFFAHHKMKILFGLTSLLILFALIKITAAPQKYTPGPIIDAALQIKDFAGTHPGVYAMGDRAGAVGFFNPNPVIQLEGLVSDVNMIKNIKNERDLVDVLGEYGVDYYIATNPPKEENCWLLKEPKLAGQTAPRMRGRICKEPVFTFRVKNIKTYIFSLDNQKKFQ